MMNRQKEWIYGKENLCDTGMRSGRDGGTRHDGIVLASEQNKAMDSFEGMANKNNGFTDIWDKGS